jgi:hypothetical protein
LALLKRSLWAAQAENAKIIDKKYSLSPPLPGMTHTDFCDF